MSHDAPALKGFIYRSLTAPTRACPDPRSSQGETTYVQSLWAVADQRCSVSRCIGLWLQPQARESLGARRAKCEPDGTCPPRQRVNQVAITADDRLIASASLDRTARVWPIGTATEPVVLPHEQIVVGVSFAPSGSFLAVASWEEEAHVWHLEDDSGPDDLPHDANVRAIAVSRDGLIATRQRRRRVRLETVRVVELAPARVRTARLGPRRGAPGHVPSGSLHYRFRGWK